MMRTRKRRVMERWAEMQGRSVDQIRCRIALILIACISSF
ncbi:hypothetical protein OIU78_020692 [Salix suchowensis]|nr:hypothetical protein OIU78_020692 [Salix suchowensis]